MKIVPIIVAAAMIAGSANAESRALNLVKQYSVAYGVPTNVAVAVAKVESELRCNVGGKYIGPLQISYRSARGLGFTGTYKQLKSSCDLQVKYGMKHLALGLKKARGNIRRAICKHQAGVDSKCSGNNAYTRKVLRRVK